MSPQEHKTSSNKPAAWLTLPLVGMFLLDMWSHPHPNSGIDLAHIFPKADLGRRAAIADLGGIGPILSEVVGNYGYAASYMISVMILSHSVKELGIRRDNETLKKVGDLIPLMGLLSLAALTLYIESTTPNNHQITGDLVATAIGGLHGALATHVALNPFHRPRRQRAVARLQAAVVN